MKTYTLQLMYSNTIEIAKRCIGYNVDFKVKTINEDFYYITFKSTTDFFIDYIMDYLEFHRNVLELTKNRLYFDDYYFNKGE